MIMPQRSTSSGSYRYGFNGQEKSDEIKGSGNSYTAEFWEYDPRLGRRWNVDPVVKPFESSYATFSNNPIYYTDFNGLDAEPNNKKPGMFKKAWRVFTGTTFLTRAENYAFQLKSVANVNVVNVDEYTRVVIARFDFDETSLDENGNPLITVRSSYKFSIFREDRGGISFGPLGGSKNDDINLTTEQFVEGYTSSKKVLPFPGLPGGGISKGASLASQGSKLFLVQSGAKLLQNWRKVIRMGVNDPDVLNKGFHLHFDEGLELGLKTLHEGKIGLELVGKKTFSLLQVENAVSVFNGAMKSATFRQELLVRLVASQNYLQQTFKFTKDAQRALDKAHELNYIIKSVQNWK